MLAPQCVQAQIELERIADVKYQILTPQSSAPIIAIKEDALVGSFNMTAENLSLDWRTAMNMLSATKMDNYAILAKDKIYPGKEVYSTIIPKKINMFKGDATKTVISIKNGEIMDGRIVDAVIGAKKKNNLVQLVLDEYGVEGCVNILDNITRLVNNFNLFHGMTVGVGDLDVSYDLIQRMYQVFQTKKTEVKHDISEYENNPDILDEELFETSIKQKLDIIRDDIGKLIFNNLKPNNNVKIMNECGSKGSILNIGQMCGCVGNQDFQGSRMPKSYNDRTLPYFFKNDDSAEARGFIEGSYLNGINLSEFIFHHVAGREGLIDQALKTASSGYLQRKFIKATEDFMIKYDGTVRNAVDRIQQFIYGDSGIDTVRQYDYKFKIMDMNNAEVADKFKFTKDELKNLKNFGEKENEAFYKDMLKMRDHLRDSQIKATFNYLALNSNYMFPVNINRIVDSVKSETSKEAVLNEPEYIINMIEHILLPDQCRLYSMTEDEMKNPKCPKTIDDKLSKTAFRYALYESLAPKKCITIYKLTKKQIDSIAEQIITSFNRSVVEPGEMVGILGAQSLGEPVTQMVLNSVDWKEEILVRDIKLNKDIVVPIGKFIDETMEKEKESVVQMGDNLENNMKGIYYLDSKDKNYYIQSVNEDGKISWKKIEAFTKHLPINKDGSDTLIKVTTRMGKTVIATKGKSFLTQKNNKVLPIRGDEIKVGDYLPIMKNYDNSYTLEELDITKYFPKNEYIYGSEIVKAKELKIKNLSEGNREWFKNYIGKDFIVPYSRQDSLKVVIDNNFDYRENCIYPKKSRVNTHIPEKIKLDNDFGFLVGAYLAEGCITKTQISISNNNKDYRDRIATFCNKYSLGYHEVCKPKEKTKMATTDGYEIRIHSNMLVKVIKDICGKYSYGKYVPDFAFNSNLNFIKGLLDGYISGDGNVQNVGRRKYISVTSVSKNLLVGINVLLTKFGIIAKMSTNKLQLTNNLNSKVIHQTFSLMIRNNNIIKFSQNINLTDNKKNLLIKNICEKEFKFDNGYYDIYPSVKLETIKETRFRRDKLKELLEINISVTDKKIINTILNNDVYFDEIISIEEVKPSNTYVYDFTIEETQNFIMANGLCMRDSFHHTGLGMNAGVPRIQEVFSLSKNLKAPIMMVYLDKEHRVKKDFAKKIRSHIKFTTIKDLRTKIDIFYDDKPYEKGSFMEKDNVYNIFYAFQQSKSCCLNKVDGLPWLMRIEFDKEKLMNKEVTLLDIKSKFCVEWEKRYQDVKGMKREKRQILDKITQLAVLTNSENDTIPIMHVRFDMTNYNSSTLIDFMDMFIDEFKLKGLTDIQDVVEGTESEARMITFDNPNGDLETKNTENIIITNGINMSDIRNIIGVDLTRTYCNDIIMTYEMFGIEAARNLIIKEITNVFSANGSPVNHQHISIFGDLMTNVGTLTSIDRHGLNKLDTDPLARASFEKSVEQLITAAVFNEIDHMKSVSSRIMAGLCIKGGTGLCNLVLDRDLLENSEYTVDIGQLYNKTFDDIVPTQSKQEVDTEVFIPEF